MPASSEKNKKSVSVTGTCHAKLVARAKLLGIPHSPLAEIVIARGIGMPIEDLPAATRAWALKLDEAG